jgi:hypothetical protein
LRPGVEGDAVLRAALFILVTLTITACSGGGSTPAPTSPTPVTVVPPTPAPAPSPPPGPPTITITASGMTPLEITIAVGQRVTFVNNDQRAHDVVGGIDPAHPDCPEIVQPAFSRQGSARHGHFHVSAHV